MDSIVARTGIQRTLSLEKYLGFPMLHGRLQRRHFEFLEEKISQKLASWQNKLLNKAGRLTLVKSVLNSIPNYYMQIASLPQTICDSIDRMARNFLWKGNSNGGVHLVGWRRISKPKNLGGLGIRKAREANTAMLGKLVWSLHQEPNALWAQVLKHKYVKGTTFLDMNKKPGSSVWNTIMKALFVLKDGFEFRLGDGSSSFWFSNWSTDGKLAVKVPFVDIHDLQLQVNDVYVNDNWNFNLLYTNLPSEVRDRLQSLPLCLNALVPSRITWKGNLDGIYTARDGYYWLNRNEFVCDATNNICWSWMWHIPAPVKLKFFIWTTLHESLPTRSLLCHRGIIQMDLCPRCNRYTETILHCLRDCEFAVLIWKSLGFIDHGFYHENVVYEWLRSGIHGANIYTFLAAC